MKARKLKSSTFFVIFILTLALNITSCIEDDSDSLSDTNPQLNDVGLQIDVKPINQDTIAIYDPAAIELLGEPPLTNDFGTEYTLNIETTNPEKIKKGNVIVDYANGGRLWIIKDTPNGGRPAGSAKSINGITVILGTINTFFTNALVEVSTPTNRAKNSSSSPNKLESGKFKMYSATKPLVTVDLSEINLNEITVSEGVSISVENNTVNVNLSEMLLYANEANTLNISIPQGNIQVNNAVDMRYKFLPFSTVFLDIPLNIGNLQDFESAIYTSIDTDLMLDIEATTNGPINLINPVEKELLSYTKVIPIPPYFAASINVKLKTRLTINTETQLNISSEISTKNNFEARATYDGLLSLPNFQPIYQNVETNLANSINGNFNLNQRLEIIPEVEVYAFGLLGPKGEVIAYQEFNANANIQNEPFTWDTAIDLGVDYNTSLDISIFHLEQFTNSLATKSGNVFEFDLFDAPNSAEIISGNNQVGFANNALQGPIEILVTNSLGQAMSGVAVFFDTVDGSFNTGYVITDDNGIATNVWTLGNNIGEQNAIAYVKDGNGVSIEVTELNLAATAESSTTTNPANNPSPTNGATNVALNGTLFFIEGSNTPSDATYRLYFDNSSNPVTSFDLGSQTSFMYSNLQENTTYYWYVETLSNTSAVVATSPIWNFTTGQGSSFEGELVFVEGGTFDMGSDEYFLHEQPVHAVSLNSFLISKYEITNQQYADFLNSIIASSDGSVNGIEYIAIFDVLTSITYDGNNFIPDEGKENHPVLQVSWFGAKAFCEYYGGRLPTEAEWEFAARGGINSNDYLYSGSNTANDVAWYGSNTSGWYSQVGAKNPNELNIYDMSGNVSEWTNDWYDENYYSVSPINNPQGPATGTHKTTRGGSFTHPVNFVRSTHRYPINPSNTELYLGFRPVFNP